MTHIFIRCAGVLLLGAALLGVTPSAQDRLKSMPGYDRYQKVSAQLNGAIRSGAVSGAWSADGKTIEYTLDGKRYRFDVAAKTSSELGLAPEPASGRGGRGGRGGSGIERGRQAVTAEAPDGKLKAFYRDRNLWVSDTSGANESAITTDGSDADRVKYGTASWVYGEELSQTSAIWWSPTSTKVAYYRFDEKQVLDYNLQLDQTKIQSRNDVEAYPKAGANNPAVDLFVYDVATKKTTKVDVRDGKPFENAVVGHYVYRISWTADGRELLFSRTNRRQNILELVAANPDTGATRVIVREEWPTGWVENRPTMQFLKDNKRFIWESERNGFSNLYLYDLSGKLLNPITAHTTFEVTGLVKVDEAAGVVFYTARDGDNHLKLQLHRVGLDGKGDVRLTDPAFHHTIGSCMTAAAGGGGGGGRGGFNPSSCGISPDSKYFIDTYQTHDTPPATRIVDAAGKSVAEIAKSDLSKFDALSLKKAEMFTYKAADGQTTLRGLIQFPSNFDPSKKYPVLVPVYGGPASASNTARETFVTPSAITEYGFLLVNLDSRAAPGMGKRTLDSIYLKLGQVEIDDMAAGVKALWSRPYVDKTRVGMYGTSYGGYSSVMSLLRYPDVYAAASSSSPVTAWDHYDTIYTERYMWIPQENKTGYELGSAMKYAANLKGRLMLYYGTADNNVHPSNMMQLIAALQQAGKSFDVQVGPDRGHSGINTDRMMEFFIENLIVRPPAPTTTSQ
ncbi:MAG TPA: DPP IV N-terminal domain-containing protein [Vicinamibacterales bacterium]